MKSTIYLNATTAALLDVANAPNLSARVAQIAAAYVQACDAGQIPRAPNKTQFVLPRLGPRSNQFRRSCETAATNRMGRNTAPILAEPGPVSRFREGSG